MTNILALPVITTTVEICATEDWRDSWAFGVASSALPFPAQGNTGNGQFAGGITVAQATPVGDSILTILSVNGGATVFGVADPDGIVFGAGLVGVPFTAAGFVFTLAEGSVAFVAGDAFTIAVLEGPLDISGIEFELTVRDQSYDIGIVLVGSTADFSLINGGAGGTLGTNFPVSLIQNIAPALYVFDIRAKSAGIAKRAISGTLNVLPAVTI